MTGKISKYAIFQSSPSVIFFNTISLLLNIQVQWNAFSRTGNITIVYTLISSGISQFSTTYNVHGMYCKHACMSLKRQYVFK